MIMEHRSSGGFSICDILQLSNRTVDEPTLVSTNVSNQCNLKSLQKQSASSSNSNTPTPTSLMENRIPAFMQEVLPLWLTCAPALPFERNFIVAQRTGDEFF
uniref:Uncharacterized protein n=1 Tax=Syphacia muris TaxID=451379 RepID=A0A0N5AH89_9BILA